MKMSSIMKKFYRGLPVIKELNQVRLELHRQNLLVKELIGHADVVNEAMACKNDRFMDGKRLLKYGFQVCSQNKEDGMIHEIFKRLGVAKGVFAEVGVGNGHENNTAFLLSQGWEGYWIDGNSEFLDTLAQPEYNGFRIRGRQEFVTRENISNVFRDMAIPNEFDLLALDIDRNTYHVWEGLADYRPKVVVIEYNSALPPDVDWVIKYEADKTWDGSQNFGASLLALEKLGRRLGYGLVGCDFVGINAFFVRNDYLTDHPSLFCAPFDSMNHYEPPRYRFFQRFTHPGKMLT